MNYLNNIRTENLAAGGNFHSDFKYGIESQNGFTTDQN